MRRLIAGFALVLVAAACTVPAPSATPVWSEVCVPAESVRSTVVATPIYVPEGGGWIDWNFLATTGGQFPDSVVSEGTATDLVAGQSVPLGVYIDPGLCIHIKPSPGLTYSLAQVPYLLSGAETLGWEPGVTYP